MAQECAEDQIALECAEDQIAQDGTGTCRRLDCTGNEIKNIFFFTKYKYIQHNFI